MPKQLLIVFVKNIQLGKVKTRLAKTIGDKKALEVYKKLIAITEKSTQNINVDCHIYYSDFIDNNYWNNTPKFIQKGNDIGERMANAFKDSFNKGYQQIILIGSDIPDINETIINNGFKALETTPIVFGPAEDGGYYLVGMKINTSSIFMQKPWSQPSLLEETLTELKHNNQSYTLLETLNDIDTFEDLKSSSIYNEITKSILLE